jgi:tetratricopeptide (TPR) repeat protein
VGDWWVLALVLAGAAMTDIVGRDTPTAEGKLARASEAAARSGNPYVIAYVALNRGRFTGFLGRLDEAQRWFAEAIGAYETMGDRRFALVAESDLAHALRQGGALDEAEAAYRQTLPQWLDAGARGAIANQLEGFAFIALARSDAKRAATLLGAAEALREQAEAEMLPVERYEYDQAVGRLRGSLPTDALERAWSSGRAMSMDDAVRMASSAAGSTALAPLVESPGPGGSSQ